MSKRLTYKPNLKLDKQYYTDGKIELKRQQDSEQIQTIDKNKLTVENLTIKINELNTVSVLIPESLKKNYLHFVHIIEFLIIQIDIASLPKENIKNDDKKEPEIDPDTGKPITDPDEEIDIIVREPEKNTDKVGSDYNFLVSSSIPTADIINVKKDPIKIVSRYYSGALLSILDNYIDKLKKGILDYYTDMSPVIKEHGTDIEYIEKKYTYKTTDLDNKNLQHLSDFIAKCEIVLDQKKRMMNKIYSERETLNKIKACEIARELEIRYLKEEKKPNKDFNDLIHNMILKESQLQYDKKIDQSLYELYKYLNSSVILFNECLGLYTRQSQAKMLLKKENIEF